VTPTARRQVVEVLTTEHELSVRRACRVVGLARTAWYTPPADPAVRDAAVIEALQTVVETHARWGFWKCYDRLRLDGRQWNHKRVHRVYCALRLNLPRRTRRRVPPRFGTSRPARTRSATCWSRRATGRGRWQRLGGGSRLGSAARARSGQQQEQRPGGVPSEGGQLPLKDAAHLIETRKKSFEDPLFRSPLPKIAVDASEGTNCVDHQSPAPLCRRMCRVRFLLDGA
jgi:hypothetical protein